MQHNAMQYSVQGGNAAAATSAVIAGVGGSSGGSTVNAGADALLGGVTEQGRVLNKYTREYGGAHGAGRFGRAAMRVGARGWLVTAGIGAAYTYHDARSDGRSQSYALAKTTFVSGAGVGAGVALASGYELVTVGAGTPLCAAGGLVVGAAASGIAEGLWNLGDSVAGALGE